MIKDYILDISNFPFKELLPWEITSRLEELIPETQSGDHSNLGTIGFAIGFVIMMLDSVL